MDNHSLIERDLSVLWHPCTQMKDHERLPIIPIRSARGIWLEDFNGNRYIDAISSWWVNLFGHCHPHINAAVKQQIETLEHVMLAGFSHEPAILLAEKLRAITPASLVRCFFADNGSSAVEVALKMSFHYWKNQGRSQKTKFVTLENSYHGETLGALAVGDVSLYKETYAPLLMKVITAPSPDCYFREKGQSWEDYSRAQFSSMERILANQADEICAVIVEPLVQCAGGMRMYHPCYLQLLREACDRYQIHLIADEIAVGFGRTGTLFACEQADISPDFLCLSKGLTGGYLPLSAVMTTEDVYQAFYTDYEQHKAFLHSHSYTGNPIACAAALATLELFANEPIIETNRKLATQMQEAVVDFSEHPNIGDIRQTGMILALEMVSNKANKTPYPGNQRKGLQVYQYGLMNNVLLRPLGNVIYFMPPYVINADEIRQMVAVAKEGIHQTCSTD